MQGFCRRMDWLLTEGWELFWKEPFKLEEEFGMPKLAEVQKKLVFEAIAIATGLIVAFIPAPNGLEQNAMKVLGLLVWAIVNWVSKAIPDFAAIFIMCCGWVILGVVPFAAAFGSFAGTTVWLLIGALGIGIAVTKSGLLSRLALYAMKLCPPTFSGQVVALLGAGTLIGPFIPSTTAKVAITGTMSTSIGEKLGFADRSKGITGMWAAMYTGFALTAPLIMSSSFFAYIILALLPEKTQQQFTFGYWFIAMIPWGIVVLISSYFAIRLLYKPEKETPIPKEQIRAMMDEMGPMKREEKITLFVLLLCIFFWIMERALGIPATITAVMGLAVLLCLDIVSPKDYNTGIPWSLVTFVGGAINLASALTAVHVDTWIGNTFGPSMATFTGNPYLFVVTVAIAVELTRLVIVDPVTCLTLYIVILAPFCLAAGTSPWITGICAYVVIQPWFLKYQNVNFLVGYASAGGDEKIGFKNTVPYCFVFHMIAIIGLLVSVPYWKMLGLIGQ